MIREISITPVLNGFICKVGCQRVVFESVSRLVDELEKYLRNPSGTEQRFINDAVNKMPDQPSMQTTCEPTSMCGEITSTQTDAGQSEARGPQPIERRTARESSRVTENRASDPSPSEGGNALGPRR